MSIASNLLLGGAAALKYKQKATGCMTPSGCMSGMLLLAIIFGLVYAIGLPFFALVEYIDYLEQFFVKRLPDGLSVPAVPAFIFIFCVVFLTSIFMFFLSFFNLFPNYASRAIFIFFTFLTIAVRDLEDFSQHLGVITFGYDDKEELIAPFHIFAILSFLYFTVARFRRFRSQGLNDSALYKESKSDAELEDIGRRKVAISAFLNRRVNRGFIMVVLAVAAFDPNFWPDIPFEYQFWQGSGSYYNPSYEPPEAQYYANLDATPAVILRTAASYIFIVFLIFTFQMRSAMTLHWQAGCAGYIPPHYVYGLGIAGGFCAAVFAFVPYDQMGDEGWVLQALPPLLFIGTSLCITGIKYYRFLKMVEAEIDG